MLKDWDETLYYQFEQAEGQDGHSRIIRNGSGLNLFGIIHILI